MSEDINRESLSKSVKVVGELHAIIVNQNGKVLDGNHRIESNPLWHTQTVNTKNRAEEILVRLHAHHRRQIPQEETKAMLIELAKELEKDGVLAENVTAELYKLVPYSESYVRRLLPEIYKQPEKVEAGKVSAELVAQKSAELAHQTVKTQDTALEDASLHKAAPKAFDAAEVKKCERCHVDTTVPKTWHGHTLCSHCETKANFNPEAYDGYFRYLERGKATATTTRVQVPAATPSSVESYADKDARMHTPHSRMEEKIVNKLRAKGYTVETDVKFVVKEIVTIPDFNIALGQRAIHGYIDGVVHNGKRRDKDEELRLLLKKRYPNDLIIPVDVKGDSDKEADEKIAEIEEAMKW
jgi:hypothetical protein